MYLKYFQNKPWFVCIKNSLLYKIVHVAFSYDVSGGGSCLSVTHTKCAYPSGLGRKSLEFILSIQEPCILVVQTLVFKYPSSAHLKT